MALTKCVLCPAQAGYSATDGEEVISTILDGGASRTRRDIIGATSKITATWVCNPRKFRYMRAFYRAITLSGALPFTIDLILDSSSITEHEAKFIPGSMRTSSKDGEVFVVEAELEVTPLAVGEYEADYVYMFNEFGEDFEHSHTLSALDDIVNIDLPGELSAGSAGGEE